MTLRNDNKYFYNGNIYADILSGGWALIDRRVRDGILMIMGGDYFCYTSVFYMHI